jgi:hypothetical protein
MLCLTNNLLSIGFVYCVGPDKGAYYHELFERGKPELARGITEVKGEGKRGRKPQATEPNFHGACRKMAPSPPIRPGGFSWPRPDSFPTPGSFPEKKYGNSTDSSEMTSAPLMTTHDFFGFDEAGCFQQAAGPSTVEGGSWVRVWEGREEENARNDNVHGLLGPPTLGYPILPIQKLDEDQLNQQIQSHTEQLLTQVRIQEQLEADVQSHLHVLRNSHPAGQAEMPNDLKAEGFECDSPLLD